MIINVHCPCLFLTSHLLGGLGFPFLIISNSSPIDAEISILFPCISTAAQQVPIDFSPPFTYEAN